MPVIFANQCGETHTTIPVLGTRIKDRFAGQSSICDGRHGDAGASRSASRRFSSPRSHSTISEV